MGGHALIYDGAVSGSDGAAPESVVSVTFDNLGEAAQLELGMWPRDVPQGQHFTVVEVLPRLLDLLGTRGLEATFYAEGLNAQMYPRALHTILDAGHEVAVHAWRHEEWAALAAESEAALLQRATSAMRAIGIEPSGFRPPGGGLTGHTLGLLAELGYSHVSPAGEKEGVLDGIAVLPFRWPLVDAYAYLPQFAALRERYGEGPEPFGAAQMGEAMTAALRACSEQGGHLTLIFHPFSAAFTGEAGWEALDRVLLEATRLEAAGALEAMRMDEAAARMLRLSDELMLPPELDSATWMSR
jgi:peptidoglycan/xylan/chitin deacetylase (PgdA/CDA1 family)